MWLEMDAIRKRNQFLEAETEKAKNQAHQRSAQVRRLELALSALMGAVSASAGSPLDYEDVRRICSTVGITELKFQFDENMSTHWYALDIFPPDISGLLRIIEEQQHRAATAVAFARRALERGSWGDVENAIYALDCATRFSHPADPPAPQAESPAPQPSPRPGPSARSAELSPRPAELSPRPAELSPRPAELSPRPAELSPRPAELSLPPP